MKKDTKETKSRNSTKKKMTKPQLDSFDEFVKYIFKQNYLFRDANEKNYFKQRIEKPKKENEKLKKERKKLKEKIKELKKYIEFLSSKFKIS